MTTDRIANSTKSALDVATQHSAQLHTHHQPSALSTQSPINSKPHQLVTKSAHSEEESTVPKRQNPEQTAFKACNQFNSSPYKYDLKMVRLALLCAALVLGTVAASPLSSTRQWIYGETQYMTPHDEPVLQIHGHAEDEPMTEIHHSPDSSIWELSESPEPVSGEPYGSYGGYDFSAYGSYGSYGSYRASDKVDTVTRKI